MRGEPIRFRVDAAISPDRTAKVIILTANKRAVVVCRPKVEIGPQCFPDETPFPPARKLLQRLTGQSIGAPQLDDVMGQEFLRFIAGGKDGVLCYHVAAPVRF
jgi:hypothetical protein